MCTLQRSLITHCGTLRIGSSASGMHFQAFLLDGLVRWNKNRAATAKEGEMQPLLCYSGHLQHSLNQLSQCVLGSGQVEDFTKPGVYTGISNAS